jgi:hypothetical protein
MNRSRCEREAYRSHEATERAGPSGARADDATVKVMGVAQALGETRPPWLPRRSQARTPRGEAREEESVSGGSGWRRGAREGEGLERWWEEERRWSSCGRRIGSRAQLSIVGEERHGSKLDGVG